MYVYMCIHMYMYMCIHMYMYMYMCIYYIHMLQTSSDACDESPSGNEQCPIPRSKLNGGSPMCASKCLHSSAGKISKVIGHRSYHVYIYIYNIQ